MIQVIRVVPKEDFELEVELDTGENLVLDVKPLLVKPAFSPLKDEPLFRHVRVDDFVGLEWPNGADICVDWILAQTTHHESRVGAACAPLVMRSLSVSQVSRPVKRGVTASNAA